MLPPLSKQIFSNKSKIAIVGLFILALLVPLFISLGLWQWNKAQQKQLAKQKLESYRAEITPFNLYKDNNKLEWQYRHVSLEGEFEANWQILIDNRVFQEKIGYHVLAPFRLAKSEQRVWINRGWIAKENQDSLTTPSGNLYLTGTIQLPAKKYFSLENESEKEKWKKIWQQPDFKIINKHLPWQTHDLQIQLDKNSEAGFIREWQQKDDKIAMHLSYAMQWFGFAISSILIWLYFLLRKTNVK